MPRRHIGWRWTGTATAALVVLLAAAPADAETSYWDTNFGDLEITVGPGDRVTGFYPDYNGRMVGALNRRADSVEGFWIQPQSRVECPEEKMDTRHWGRVVWWLEPDGTMDGAWSYCNSPVGSVNSWRGRMVAGVHPLDVATLEEDPPAPDAHLPDGALQPARFLWGPDLDPQRLEARRDDVTCDGRPDMVLQYLELESADGPVLTIAIHEPHKNLEAMPVAWFEFDSQTYAGLCGTPRLVDMDLVTIEPESVLDLTGYTSPPVCTQGIVLDDTRCDRLWLFTTPGENGLRDFVLGRH